MRCRGAKHSGRIGLLAAFWGAAVAIWVASAPAQGLDTPKPDVVSIGGSITEIVYALGQAERLVARDTTSTYPPEAKTLPDVGYMRALSPEGVLSVGPELILAEEGAGPPEAIEVLKSAGVPIVGLPEVLSAEGVARKIRDVGAALGVPAEADVLAAQVEADMAAAHARAARRAGEEPKKVLFVLSMQGGRVLASGRGTAADAIIRLAGGVNAVAEIEGYKTLTDEAVSRAAPDVILMMDREGDHAISDEVIFSMPAFMPTPAARDGAIVRMDGLFMLGFGPRTAEAVDALSASLYGS
ncbi:MAG: ABC transporter substrate-binding protein [Roseovarius sp.]